MSLIQGMDKTRLLELMGDCMDSTRAMCETFFPEAFFRQFDPPHQKIFNLLEDDDHRRVVIAAPRCIGKTSIVRTFILQCLLFQTRRCIVYFSANYDMAEQLTENIKSMLVETEMIGRLFGPQKSPQWAAHRWVTRGGTIVVPKGNEQKARGFLFKSHRPDLIIVDDLEDDESVATPEQRKKVKDLFFSKIVNLVDIGSKDWRIIYIGTLLHGDALLADLLEDKEWTSLPLSICDDDYKTLWPVFMPQEELDSKVAGYRRRGQMDVFAREFRNIPMASEDATFLAEHFKTIKPEDIPDAGQGIQNVITWDPAKTQEEYSCDSAIVCWGVDWKRSRLYVRQVVAGKLQPQDQYEAVIKMARRFNVRVVGVEDTSLNMFVTQPFIEYALKEHMILNVQALKARGKKEDRIKSLAPYYSQGMVYHVEGGNCGALERQLLAFPRGKRIDIADAAAWLVELLDLSGRHFGVTVDDDTPDGRKRLEAIYKQMEDAEEPPFEEWRVAV